MSSIKEIIKSKLKEGYSLKDLLHSELEDRSREEKLLLLIDDNSSVKSDVTIGSLMIGDFVYDYLRLDPNVIKAVDFSRKESITDLFEFSSFSRKINGDNLASLNGNVHNIKGYVGEQLAAQHLQSQGYEVEFPSTSNNEAYDLLVNGEKFQVKISSDGQSIRDHLTEHPDIPVFTNSDIPASLIGNPNVYPINGITEQGLEDITRDSLDAGIEIFDIEIPGIIGAVVIGKNTYRLITSDIDAKSSGINVLEEVVARGGGAFVGAEVVGFLGASLGPYGAIVGSMIGAVFGGSRLNRVVQDVKTKWRLPEETKAVKKNMKYFLIAAYKNAIVVKNIFNQKTELLLNNLKKLGDEYRPLYDFTAEKVARERIYFVDKIEKLKHASTNPEVLIPSYIKSPNLLYISGKAVLTAMQAKVHPYSINKELQNLTAAVENYQNEYKKL